MFLDLVITTLCIYQLYNYRSGRLGRLLLRDGIVSAYLQSAIDFRRVEKTPRSL